MPSILILGATSSIAKACSEVFASRDYRLFLAGRDLEELSRIASDLRIRFKIQVYYGFFDITQFDTHTHFLEKVLKKMGGIHGVLMAIGSLAKENRLTIVNTNFLGPISILIPCADYLASQKRGFIIGLSSVAGDRGRPGHYIYGASKSGLTTYLQGLRSYLYPQKVHVLTIKLGLIDTKMTFGTHYPLFLAADPKKTGLKIIQALDKGKESVYIPRIWRSIMFVIRMIPEKIFKHLNF